jgi:hypothetical protein
MDHDEIKSQLNRLAFKKSNAFCYGCYRTAPTGICEICRSDDLMREVPGVGVEYGTDWIVTHLLEDALTPVNVHEAFEQYIQDAFPEPVKVGWREFDVAYAIKELDPVSWRCALVDWESNEEGEGNIFSIDGGSTYYWTHEVETYIDENDLDPDNA